MPWRGRQHSALGIPRQACKAASLAVEGGKEYQYNPGLSRISGVLSDVTDMSTGMDGACTGRNCILMSALILAVFSMSVPFCNVPIFMQVVTMLGHKVRMDGSMVFY